jgi:outer membrane protein insertion porin family
MMLGALGLALMSSVAPEVNSVAPLLSDRSAIAGGAPVVSVTVDGAASDVSRYLAIEAGRPLDPAQVRRTVELLHATGAYEDVVVEEADAPGGTAVTIRLLAAPLMTEVVVEGDAVLSPDQIRDVARLRRGEPLWPERLEAAARDVAVDLGRRGYLEARVTAVPRREAGGAAAVFTMASGPQVLVQGATVESTEPSVAALLLEHVEPDAGEPFDRERARKAAEAMRQALVSRERWRAKVEVVEAYDPAASRIRLLFRAEPGPLLGVRLHGADVRSGAADRVRDVLRDGAAGTDAIEEGRDILEAELRRDGHRKAAVTPSEDARPGRVDIVYALDPGSRSVVGKVTVDDAAAALPADLALRTRVGAPVRDADLAEDERALARALEDAGYADARVEAETADANAGAGEGAVAVVFRVTSGPATRVASVDIVDEQGGAAPRPPELRAASSREAGTEAVTYELRLRPGAPYRLRDVAADRATLTLAYRNDGYLSAEVTPEVEVAAGEARVRLVVSPGPRTIVDRVVVAGLDRTREDVVRRELRMREGEPLGVDDLLETQRRLSALGLFEAITIVELAAESPGRRTLVIRVDEAPRTSVSYGIGYGERDLVRGSVEVTRRNLFGMDRRLSAFVRMSFRGSRFLASFREPYLLGRRQELFVTAFRDEEDREAFDYARYGVSVQTARALARRWNLVLRQTYQEIRTYNVVEDCLALDRQFCPATLSGPSASLVSDTRDDPLDPARGYFLLTDAQLSHRVLGGDTLMKAFVQASGYRRLASRLILALSGRVGMGRTFGEEPLLLPIPERFFAGGDYSLRGFGVDDVREEGGNGVLLGTAELRVDTGGGFSVAAFTDAGNVYRLASDMTLKDLRYTAGAGIRYKSALGPLRLDWGYKLDRRDGESASHVHVTIGHAF